MIIWLKNISQKYFSPNVNVNASLKFLWALGGISGAIRHLGTQRARGHSEYTRRALEAHSDTWDSQSLEHLGHSDTQALEHSDI